MGFLAKNKNLIKIWWFLVIVEYFISNDLKDFENWTFCSHSPNSYKIHKTDKISLKDLFILKQYITCLLTSSYSSNVPWN